MLFESTWVYFEYTKLTLYTNTNTIATQTLTLKLFSESIKLKEKKTVLSIKSNKLNLSLFCLEILPLPPEG